MLPLGIQFSFKRNALLTPALWGQWCVQSMGFAPSEQAHFYKEFILEFKGVFCTIMKSFITLLNWRTVVKINSFCFRITVNYLEYNCVLLTFEFLARF